MTRLGLIALCSALVAAPLPPAAAQTLLWTRQAGTSAQDWGYGVAVDGAGNAYIAGLTVGSLGGPNAGSSDAFLAKYDTSGALLWTRQLGTSEPDYGLSVAVDGAGNAYITGFIAGANGGDAFLAKYDATGTPLWTRQLGTSVYDVGSSVAVDGAGNAYITGTTGGSLGGPYAGGGDVFLAKYNASGTLLWTRQLGTAVEDRGEGVAVDSAGNAYIAGVNIFSTGGASDAFLAKYDASGTLLWTRQLGTAGATSEWGRSVAVDGAGNAYIAGYTTGSLGGANAGLYDAFLAKYDASGAPLWTRQFGTSSYDDALCVAVDGAGNAYIAGWTASSLGGPSAGGTDAFMAKYDASGAPLWMCQLGTIAEDHGLGVGVDGAGNAYITGWTFGSLGGPNAGAWDYFLAKYGPPACYPNCDGSSIAPLLNVNDFVCFLNKFAAGDSYANCDSSTAAPTLNVNDFICFTNRFAAGCP